MNIPITQVVSEFLDEINGGQAEFSKAYRIAVRGVRELSYDVTGEIKSTELTVNPDGTATLPDWCIRVERLGYSNGDGTITALRENRDLSTGIDTANGNHYDSGDTLYYGERVFPYMRPINQAFPYYQTSLGVGSYSNVGDYKIEGSVVYLGNHIQHARTIVAECHSLPEVNGELGIHPFASEALLAWIRMKWNIQRRDVGANEKMLFKMEYKRTATLAKNRLAAPTKQELNQYIRQTQKGGLKS